MADIQVYQGYVLAAVQLAAADLQVTQGYVLASAHGNPPARVLQAYVLVAVSSRPYDPTVRAWTFTLDGHDFYVLRLGSTDESLIFDTHSKQWYVWGSDDTDILNLLDGTNWDGGHAFSGAYGSNVLVGSDINGALFLLDPEGTDDDSAVDGVDDPRPFLRAAMAQFVVTGYDSVPCWGVQVFGSVGDVRAPNPTDVTLEISDDRGDSYYDCGTVSITADDFAARVQWHSLGSMSAPGRLFRITDYGALHRIDSVEMPDGAETPES